MHIKKQLFFLIIVLIARDCYTIMIKSDDACFDSLGYDNCDMKSNGELYFLENLIDQTNIVFDVGANKGEWSFNAIRLNPLVKIYAFEPVLKAFEGLKSKFKEQNNIAIFNTALSKDITAKTLFFYDKNEQITELSGLYHRPILDHLIGTKPQQVTIQTETLDFFCKRHSIDAIDFLKIDTEGSELDILLGAYELLSNKQIKIIQLEYGGTYLDSNTTLKEVYDLFSSLDYTLYRMVPWGLIKITAWRLELETFRYSNYIATV